MKLKRKSNSLYQLTKLKLNRLKKFVGVSFKWKNQAVNSHKPKHLLSSSLSS